MAYTISTPSLGYPPITSIDTAVPKVALGTIVTATDPTYGSGEFILLKGLDSTVVGSWVTYNADDWTTTLAVADAVGPVAVAMGICVTGDYGWYQISGKAVGKVLSGFVDNATPYLTSTAGSLDDTAVAGDYVHNAKGASAIDTPSTGLAEFEISRPWVANGTDDAVT